MDDPTADTLTTDSWPPSVSAPPTTPAPPASPAPVSPGLPMPAEAPLSSFTPRAAPARPPAPTVPAPSRLVPVDDSPVGPPDTSSPARPRRRGRPDPARRDPAPRRKPLAGLTRRLKALLGLIVAVLAVLAVAYVLLSATIVAAARVDGTWVVATRNPSPAGQIPSGTLVVTTSGTAPTGLLDRAQQAILGIPGLAVSQIIAGPTDTLTKTHAGDLKVNGEPTMISAHGVTLGYRPSTDGYLIACVAGGCGTPGSVENIAVDAVVGKLVWQHGSSTLTGPDPAPSK